MIRQIIFDNEITLWWEYQREIKGYTAYLNGENYANLSSTHVSFVNLLPATEYAIKIIGDNGQTLFDANISTLAKKNVIDVSKAPYNAVGDGTTLNTTAIQKAIDDCTENSRVYIPKGTFLTGALNLHSNMELYLEEGAILQGSINREDYLPKIKSRFEGMEFNCYRSLINIGELDSKGGPNCFNVAIRGKGSLIGGGNELKQQIADYENARLKEYIESLGDKIKEYENKNVIALRLRGRLINVSNVDNFVISGVNVENSPSWNLHPCYSQNLTIYNCKFISKRVHNGDGIDPDSVINCAIFNCYFSNSDDCIAIKSGRNPEGNVVNRKTKNVYIFDCDCNGHSIAIGSEMSGGVENVYIWDCDIKAVYGVHLKFTRKRGGYIRNINVDRCSLARAVVHCVGYNDDGEPAPTITDVSGFYIRDCEIHGGRLNWYELNDYLTFKGIDEEHPIRDVVLQNVKLKSTYPEIFRMDIEHVSGLVMDNVIKE